MATSKLTKQRQMLAKREGRYGVVLAVGIGCFAALNIDRSSSSLNIVGVLGAILVIYSGTQLLRISRLKKKNPTLIGPAPKPVKLNFSTQEYKACAGAFVLVWIVLALLTKHFFFHDASNPSWQNWLVATTVVGPFAVTLTFRGIQAYISKKKRIGSI